MDFGSRAWLYGYPFQDARSDLIWFLHCRHGAMLCLHGIYVVFAQCCALSGRRFLDSPSATLLMIIIPIHITAQGQVVVDRSSGWIMSTPGLGLPSTIESLYSDHYPWLKGWLHRRLGSADHACDLAQDTFVRLLNSDRVPASIDEPRAYLTTVAQRLVSNHWRREKLERAYLEALAHAPYDVARSPEDRAILLETLFELDCLLDGLPRMVRQAFLLSQLDGHTHAQVADALGISIPTVKRYVVKALQRCFFADISFCG